MSNGSGIEEFVDKNIENTYEELTKVVNAKNNIKSCIAISAEELNRNETELEELEDVLHDIRIKISSNPVLRELNIVTEEDAILQRKLAEGIYSELPDLSSRLDLYQENFSKFNEEYNRVQNLHSAIEQSFQNKLNTLSTSKKNLKRKYDEQIRNFEEKKSKECQESRDNIVKLSESIAEENNISKSLSHEIAIKKDLLHKISGIIQHNLTNSIDLDDFEIEHNLKDGNSLINEREIELNREITELTERAHKLENEMKEFKQQKNHLEVSVTELSKFLESQQLLLKKNNLYTSIQDLKIRLTERTEEFNHLKENISKEENSISYMESKLRHCETEINDITDEISKEKQINEQQVKQKQDTTEETKILEKNMKQLNEKLSILLDNKNEEELIIKIYEEKEKLFLSEINTIKEHISATELVNKELDEKISKLQNEINEKEKIEQETPSYVDVEKENNVLELKIRRYMKAIEICKKNRVATIEKKKDFKDYSDSSQDSMLLPKKNNN